MYKTTIKVIVLSEEPILNLISLEDLGRECDEGDFVLHTNVIEQSEKLTEEQMSKELLDAGSSEDFFHGPLMSED